MIRVFTSVHSRASQLFACWLCESDLRSVKRCVSLIRTLKACALELQDERNICFSQRWFIKKYPFSPEPFQLFDIANRLYSGTRTWYNSGPYQKLVLRQIKALDWALLSPAERKKYNFTDAEVTTFSGGGKHNGNPHNLTELNTAALITYGHMLAMSGAFPNALYYYFRAYAIQPDDPLLNLSMATSYVQQALKRQAENRQHQILQGLAFLFRYYDLRTKDDVAVLVQEAEFNVGRMWHLLGLTDLALEHYDKCLVLSERVRKEHDIEMCDEHNAAERNQEEDPVQDFASEAAFAMRLIFVAGGDLVAARRIAEEWLVI